ncbi:MAG: IS3 family transposase [Candidatus Thioglobus sp.]|nr:IS3 family transposase [Candidatus Thioglobus sp.]
MAAKRKRHTPEFKTKVVLAALKGEKTSNELASQFQIASAQISTWKRQAIEELPLIFTHPSKKKTKSEDEITAPLFEEIGRLKVQLDWLKKKSAEIRVFERKMIIQPDYNLSITTQCELLSVGRSSYYYEPTGESPENLEYMRIIDERYLNHSYYGYPKMTAWMVRQGYPVNEKRIARLMRIMGLQATVPGPHTSKPHPQHKVYPYLLRGMKIDNPNLVWSTDFTYIPMPYGNMYLAAVVDWHSRFVLSWTLSNTMDYIFCLDALTDALEHGEPVIFNTDQGSQYTSEHFTQPLLERQILISMDGRGRALDNVFIERVWRSVKYENIYSNDYQSVSELRDGLANYFDEYNHRRPHQALDYATPAEVHYG